MPRSAATTTNNVTLNIRVPLNGMGSLGFKTAARLDGAAAAIGCVHLRLQRFAAGKRGGHIPKVTEMLVTAMHMPT